MIIHTASEGISLARKLETEIAIVYEKLAESHSKDSEMFLSFAKDHRKNISQIERAYYGVITDALEGGYAFNLETDKYQMTTAMPVNISYTEFLKLAIQNEETIAKFYTDAAQQSDSLMADVPRAFRIAARKKEERVLKLLSILQN